MRPVSVLVFVLLVVSACEYSPKGTFYKKLNSTPTTSITVNFNNAPDTLLMFAPLVMQYTVTGVDQARRYSVNITISPTNQAITANGLNGSFIVNPFQADGYYTVTMKVTASTGTGSLADNTGAEQIVYNKSVVLHYVTKWPITATPFQGRLKVTWPVYKEADFISYQFTASYPDTTGANIFSRHRKYIDRNSTSFIDSAYVGGDAGYSLVVVTSGSNNLFGSLNYSDVSPQLANVQIKNGQAFASWTKSKYYNNFQQYNIAIGNSAIITSYKRNINDTTISFVPDFGTNIYLYLYTRSQKGGQKTYQTFLLSDPNPVRFEYFTPNRSHNRYYASVDAVNAYDMTTNALIGSIPYVYETNSHGYSTTASSPLGAVWVYHNSVCSKVDPSTFTITQNIPFSDIAPNVADETQGLGYSDQGTLLLVNYQKIYSFNVNTKTQVALPFFFPKFSSSKEYNFTFSPDGRYFTCPGYFFQITGNTISQIGDYYDAIAFDELNTSQLLVYSQSQNSLLIEDIGTQAVLNTYKASVTLPSPDIAMIDPVTKWLLIIYSTGGHWKAMVYDLVADKQIYNGVINSTNYVLYNGVLYSGAGAKLKLN